jgi:hypothetical protein
MQRIFHLRGLNTFAPSSSLSRVSPQVSLQKQHHRASTKGVEHNVERVFRVSIMQLRI